MVFQTYIFLAKLNNVAKKQYDQKTLKQEELLLEPSEKDYYN